MPNVCAYTNYLCVFSAGTIPSTNMGTSVGVLVEYALYYKQFTRILLGTDIGGHCFSTSVDRVSTIGRTLENDDLETKS
jgi:hypothetical protein